MPKFARDSEIDLQEAYGSVLDKSVAMRRNIRTKVNMRKVVHHCEDKECGGGAPKVKCITDLHFAFCLAPVVDENIDSPTYGSVVIHGERFSVLSPTGCAEHPYSAEYNLDLKDARNGRANCEVRWKDILEAFRAKREVEKQRQAAEAASIQKQMGMTAHQRKTMLARRDDEEYRQQRLEAARRLVGNIEEHARDKEDRFDASRREASSSLGEMSSVADLEAVPASPSMWLHDQLFPRSKKGDSNSQDAETWNDMVLTQKTRPEVPVLNAGWLHAQLFAGDSASSTELQSGQGGTPSIPKGSVEEADTAQDASGIAGPSLRRKETKQLKKQRATQTRAIARTRAEDMAAQEALDKKKPPGRKKLGRLAATQFA